MRGRGMRNDRVRSAARVVTGVLAGATLCWLPVGAAHADESNTSSHNGPDRKSVV